MRDMRDMRDRMRDIKIPRISAKSGLRMSRIDLSCIGCVTRMRDMRDMRDERECSTGLLPLIWITGVVSADEEPAASTCPESHPHEFLVLKKPVSRVCQVLLLIFREARHPARGR